MEGEICKTDGWGKTNKEEGERRLVQNGNSCQKIEKGRVGSKLDRNGGRIE